jgi:hypothetical protein
MNMVWEKFMNKKLKLHNTYFQIDWRRFGFVKSVLGSIRKLLIISWNFYSKKFHDANYLRFRYLNIVDIKFCNNLGW